ncbi:MAG: response regulator [Candidatus Obscuribacterales bacterium]|nr:response regulator [Cyanobacteria bacterium SZAS LIN-5]
MASILLVEDDTDLAFAIKLWFERKGYVIQNVTTGAEALECMRFEKFDLIILDGHLPDMTGVEICSHYRSGGGTSPVLMLSGLSAEAEIAAGLAAGANEYLAKPFVMTELAKRMDSLLLSVGGSK